MIIHKQTEPCIDVGSMGSRFIRGGVGVADAHHVCVSFFVAGFAFIISFAQETWIMLLSFVSLGDAFAWSVAFRVDFISRDSPSRMVKEAMSKVQNSG